MNSAILLLVFLAAILHAAWNLASKFVSGDSGDFVFSHRLVAAVLYAPWVFYILVDSYDKYLDIWVISFIGLSSILRLVYSICLQHGYKIADLSVVYPTARGAGVLLAALGAFFILDEAVTAAVVFGISLVVLGIFLLGFHSGSGAAVRNLLARGGQWGLLIGLFVGIYTISDAYSVKSLRVDPVVLYWLTATTGTVILSPRSFSRSSQLVSFIRANWIPVFIVGMLSPLSYILILYAYGLGGNVSVVAPLRESSLIIGVLAGFFVLKETPSVAKVSGCLSIVAGAALLA